MDLFERIIFWCISGVCILSILQILITLYVISGGRIG
nr:MAG TPA: hypothetical protein [Caudoviricetes sp.]